MKLVICVKSCHWDRDRGAHDLIRDIWLKDVVGADVRFFMGNGSGVLLPLRDDEVHLDVPDDYKSLPLKTKAICQWVLGQDYTHAFLCDTGTFLIFHHLMMSDFDQHEYMGFWGMTQKTFSYKASEPQRGCPPVFLSPCWPWASGGGYTLSRKAMQIIAGNNPVVWAEDLNTAQLLARNGIFLSDGAESGWRGRVCDWIHLEQNDYPGALDRRREWMNRLSDQAKQLCESEGCNGLQWQLKNYITRDLSDPEDIDKVLAERKRMRRECK